LIFPNRSRKSITRLFDGSKSTKSRLVQIRDSEKSKDAEMRKSPKSGFRIHWMRSAQEDSVHPEKNQFRGAFKIEND
jgi:hypothetical protein